MAHWFVEHEDGLWVARNGRRRVRSDPDQGRITEYVLGLLKGSDTAVLIERDGYRTPLKQRRKRRRGM